MDRHAPGGKVSQSAVDGGPTTPLLDAIQRAAVALIEAAEAAPLATDAEARRQAARALAEMANGATNLAREIAPDAPGEEAPGYSSLIVRLEAAAREIEAATNAIAASPASEHETGAFMAREIARTALDMARRLAPVRP